MGKPFGGKQISNFIAQNKHVECGLQASVARIFFLKEYQAQRLMLRPSVMKSSDARGRNFTETACGVRTVSFQIPPRFPPRLTLVDPPPPHRSIILR